MIYLIMFVTTANTLNILPPLLDRMEVPDYQDIPKMKKLIFLKILTPNQSKYNGLKKDEDYR